MVRSLLAVAFCILMQFPDRTCRCEAAEHAHPTDAPVHHDDDCPSAQPTPEWEAVTSDAPVPPPADIVAVVVVPVVGGEVPVGSFIAAAPPPPGVPIYMSNCALRN